ncbi:hypothetical protein BDW74DRAFT_174749 [Aspergillus multicolor]|uniref:uncharacterized protein n=1 Tax=Aspergillus multicolor TaxID=41759 RepID=UPI003CCDEF1F
MSATVAESSGAQQSRPGGQHRRKFNFSRPQMRNDRKKFVGMLARYARFKGSNSDLSHYRSFDTLNATVMLYQEADLTDVERRVGNRQMKLCEPDGSEHNEIFIERPKKEGDENPPPKPDPQLAALLEEARVKLDRYYRYTRNYVKFKKSTSTTKRERSNLRTWHKRNPGAIDKEERVYIDKDDLPRILPKAADPVRDSLFGFDFFWDLPIWKKPAKRAKQELPLQETADSDEELSTEEEEEEQSPTERELHYYSGERSALFITEIHYRLLVVPASILAFGYFLALIRPDPSQDAIAPMAGYAAVVMVYMAAT